MESSTHDSSFISSFSSRRLFFCLIGALIFVGVGEGLVRFDRWTLFFQGERHVLLSNVYKASMVKEQLDQNRYRQEEHDLRVMLLGDSKLYGVGIKHNLCVGNQLREVLASQTNAKVDLLDLTRPGNNTHENLQAFLNYQEPFAPHIVVLGYNHNDVYGKWGEQAKPTSVEPNAPNALPADNAGKQGIQRTVSLRRLIRNSALLEMLLVKLNMELKLMGIILAGTEFDHLVNHSHDSAYPGWLRSQADIRTMKEICLRRGASLVAYIVPELEMLPHYQPFEKVDGLLERFFKSLDIPCVNGVEPFLKNPKEIYSLSRYDGHPNETAHSVIASHLAQSLRQQIKASNQPDSPTK